MGGRIIVKSQPGHGSVFTATIPFTVTSSPRAGRKMALKILYADVCIVLSYAIYTIALYRP